MHYYTHFEPVAMTYVYRRFAPGEPPVWSIYEIAEMTKRERIEAAAVIAATKSASQPEIARRFGISVRSLQYQLHGRPQPPSLADHLRCASSAERQTAAHELGAEWLWQRMVLPAL